MNYSHETGDGVFRKKLNVRVGGSFKEF